MKYAHWSTECNDLRFQFLKFCLVRCFTLSAQVVQGTEWKKLLVDWNEYQEYTASIDFQFHSTKLNPESCLALLFNYAKLYNETQRKMQLQLPTQNTLKKNHWNTKYISFQFHYGQKLVSKSNLQDLIVTAV